MKRLFLIDNSLFLNDNKEEKVIPLIKTMMDSIASNSEQPLIKESDFIYVNNGNNEYDKLYAVNEKIKIVESLESVDFNEYSLVVVCNTPFVSVSSSIDKIIRDEEMPVNTVLTQEGYNLSFKLDGEGLNGRVPFSKAKLQERCNISSILNYMFIPKYLPPIKNQKSLLNFLHREYPYVIFEYANTLDMSTIEPFSGYDDIYVSFVLGDEYDKSSLGNYIINIPEDFSETKAINFIKNILSNNADITLDIRTPLKFEELVNSEEFKSRLYLNEKDVLHYDSTKVNLVLDLADRHFRHMVFEDEPKYMKMYNSEYALGYKISKPDLLSAKKIAVKRTMGMGDALLTIPIMEAIYKQYGKKVDFYSLYDFRDNLNEQFIENFIKVTPNSIFEEVNGDYDIVLDFDLAYENQMDGDSYFNYYMSFFTSDALSIDFTKEYLGRLVKKGEPKSKTVVLCGEGSGWKGREPHIDVMENIGKVLTNKGYLISEPGFHRITNYANKTNPEANFQKMFDMIAEASCYIGTDSGMAHIANLMGLPCFIISGMSNPMKVLFNVENVYTFGKVEMLCFGCRHHVKGYKIVDGRRTFVIDCINTNQYECMNNLDNQMLIEELENFLIKYDLLLN